MKALKNNEGFTLIELLVVVAIIGILAAIAIPQFALYRQRGFDARSQSDLRNAATAEEAAYANGNAYVTCSDTDCNQDPPAGINFRPSKDVTLTMAAGTGSFTGTANHAQGAITWTYDSAAGGITN
jgi:type IV pilus assembly protein PilA